MLQFTQNYWLELILGFVFIFYIFPLIIRFARFIYIHHQAKHLAYLKIELPRSDSKLDQEKRTEKDFKEKVAIMSQLYRAVYEIRELNLWNLIMTRIWQADNISFELYIEKQQLSFYVVVPKKYQNILEKQITTFYNDADIKEIEKPYDLFEKGKKAKAYFMYTKRDYWYPVNTYKTMEQDPLNDVTNVFSKLEPEEKAAIQIIVNPASSEKWSKKTQEYGTRRFKKQPMPIRIPIPIIGPILAFLLSAFRIVGGTGGTNAPGASGGDSYIRMLQPLEEAIKKMGEKAGQVGFDTSIRIVGVAKDSNRATEISNNLNIAFAIYHDQYNNWFQNRRIFPIDAINNPLMKYLYNRRIPGLFHKSNLLAQDELASLYHFPDSKYNPVPVIKWLTYKVLPPPVELPAEGVLIGNNMYRGQKREIRIMRDDRTRHQYIIGKSGSGKSVLLSFMARQDIWNGDGMCLVDPHGDLVEDTLQTVPKERARDVILFDPADTERPMGLNLLEAHTPEERDRASLDAMEIFIKIFGDEIFGPRIQHYFRNACLTLMEDEEEGATLIDVPRIFTDEEFLKYKLSKVTNSVVRSFWEHEYANTGDREK
ncbi:MAG: type IV secretion system DNA-binding domain-containing protein, partial [Candidatus Peregrinibacteria bacterium]|nr:type IV secretion system DNA-binding domain-containing protein [Candidatus Peregrinibacteria bacterium]